MDASRIQKNLARFQYICIFMNVHAQTCICINTHIWMYTYSYMPTCVSVHVYLYTYAAGEFTDILQHAATHYNAL